MDDPVGALKRDDSDGALRVIARDPWSDVIRTQIHFNEIIHRTRQLTATIVIAT
jgi:hypothetical protein